MRAFAGGGAAAEEEAVLLPIDLRVVVKEPRKTENDVKGANGRNIERDAFHVR